MVNILVTGARGFIGSHFCKKSKFNKQVALVRDTDDNKWRNDALKGWTICKGDILDIRNLKRIVSQYEIDQILHLAAQSIVKQAYKVPELTYQINVVGTVNVLEAARICGVEHTIIQATDKVYGNKTKARVGDNLEPTEPYGASKICADIISQSYAKTYDMDICITRPCNVYGFDWNNRIIPNTIRSCLKGKNPIIFNEDKSLRQYIYVNDLVWNLNKIIRNKITGIHNIASTHVCDQEQVVNSILTFFPKLEPEFISKPEFLQIKDQSLVMDPDLPCTTDFMEGLDLTIKDFVVN